MPFNASSIDGLLSQGCELIDSTKALLLTTSRPDPGVFESQALEVGQLLNRVGVPYEYFVFEGAKAWLSSRRDIAKRIAELESSFGCKIHSAYIPWPLSDFSFSIAGMMVARAVLDFHTERTVLHARGPVAANIALAARRKLEGATVLYDSRADSAAEAQLVAELASTQTERQKWMRRADRLQLLEKQATLYGDRVLAVSTPLRDHLCRLAEIPTEKVRVVPCCIDPERFPSPWTSRREYRSRLGLDNKLVLVFSGSLAPYQVPDRIASLFESINALVPDSHLLVLTKDQSVASHHFGPLKERHLCTIVSSPYEEVASYLSASDLAILLRAPIQVNKVASPVKFAEYQASGLPVVVTHGIGDVSELVESSGHGVVVDFDDPPEVQAQAVIKWIESHEISSLRNQIREQGLQRYNRETYLPDYERLLSDLGVLA